MSVMARLPQRNDTPAPAGVHQAVCVDVQNLGLVAGAWGQKHKVRLVWQLPIMDDAAGRRFEVARLYTLSLHEKAALRQDLERWRGKKFTDQELHAGFDLEKLIGVNCQIQVTHDLGDDGKTWANVSTVLPAPPRVPKLAPTEFVRLKDRASQTGGAHAAR
jgi:hypothetical protein